MAAIATQAAPRARTSVRSPRFAVRVPGLVGVVALHLAGLVALLHSAPVREALTSAAPIHWNGEAVSRTELRERLAAAARQQPQPEVHIRADAAARYQWVAETLANAELTRIGFVSDPHDREP